MHVIKIIAVLFPLAFSCTIPNYDINWSLDVPCGDVRFIFLPRNIDLNENVIATNNTEIEVNFDRNISAANANVNWGFAEASKSNGTRMRIQIPHIKIAKEIFIKKRESIPVFLHIDSAQAKDLNYEKLSQFFSQYLTAKLKWLESVAIEKQCNIIIISDDSFDIVPPLPNSPSFSKDFIFSFRAVMGNEIKNSDSK
jgi:hypothetical protein